MELKERVGNQIKAISNWHFQSDQNVLIISIPRSGSTWLMELIWTQSGFKTCNEPLNIRRSAIREALKIENWEELYDETSKHKVLQYFKLISKGEFGFLNPSPFRKSYKPFTNRIVYKVINGGEPWVNEIAAITKSKVVYLIRHPFSVALSRKVLPRLEVLCSDEMLSHFSLNIREQAKEIKSYGSPLEKAVLSWCIQNALALQQRKEDWMILTYEQLVADPERVIQVIANRLNLQNVERIFKGLRVPSAVTVQSEEGTSEIIKGDNRKSKLNEWKAKIKKEERDRLWSIIEKFTLDIYCNNSSYPHISYQL